MSTVEPLRVQALRSVHEYPLIRGELMMITRHAAACLICGLLSGVALTLGLLAFATSSPAIGVYPVVFGVFMGAMAARAWWELHKMVNTVIAETTPPTRGHYNVNR